MVVIALAWGLVAVGGGAVRAGGGIWSYPTDCALVQDCINAAGPGDTVYMYADATGQSISISKSVSVKSGDAIRHVVTSVSYGDLSTPVISTIAGLDVTLTVGVFLDSSTGSSIIIRNVVVHGQAGQTAAIRMTIETSASVTVENSSGTGLGNNGGGIAILASPEGGNASFRLIGNRFSGHGNTQSGIGISLFLQSSGTVTADIYNNVIWDFGRSGQGAASGIAILPSGTVHADVNLVGNTVERSGVDGLQQRNSLAAGGQLALDMFNNTFSHAAAFGVRLTPGLAGTLAFRAGFNNYFANAFGNGFAGLPKGPGNLAVDPKFVDRANGNLKLTSTSGLLNKGQVCSPGGVANPEAANRHRVSGASVDIGAYERGAGTINGVVILGTNATNSQNGSPGADILCGYGGADTQNGMGGNDFMDGGDAGDFQVGGGGADRMLGGLGNDTLCANDGKGIDFLNGGKGDDGFRADSGDTRTSVEHPSPCAP